MKASVDMRWLHKEEKGGVGEDRRKRKKKSFETTGIIGPIAEQMCKGCFLGSQHSWVCTERPCALQVVVVCFSALLV